MAETIVREEERVSLKLRALYQKYGYLPYKMSKFEEYDLYVANKEFLVGDGVITFNDTDGRLMALKPDVTLSIIKNGVDDGEKRKVYYDESVYRISAKTEQFKEIRQVGLECLGRVTAYDVFESVRLAAASLAEISNQFVLNVSHLGILYAILEESDGGDGFTRAFLRCLGEKNAHEAAALYEKYAVKEEAKNALNTLLGAYGDMDSALKKIAPFCQKGKAKEGFTTLKTLANLLKKTDYADKIRLDFSVGGDMAYYDDIVFKGFVEGVAEGVLSGGRYDKLLSRMGKTSGGIGFAVNLDLLEGFDEREIKADVDVLLLYDEKTDEGALIENVNALIDGGESVRAQTQKVGVRYGRLLDMRGGEV